MIYPSQAVRIVIATKPVDFCKGHDGLAALSERELGFDPHSGIIVVLRAKRGDRIKVLLFDGSGLALCYKRLEQGKFAWSSGSTAGSKTFCKAIASKAARTLSRPFCAMSRSTISSCRNQHWHPEHPCRR